MIDYHRAAQLLKSSEDNNTWPFTREGFAYRYQQVIAKCHQSEHLHREQERFITAYQAMLCRSFFPWMGDDGQNILNESTELLLRYAGDDSKKAEVPKTPLLLREIVTLSNRSRRERHSSSAPLRHIAHDLFVSVLRIFQWIENGQTHLPHDDLCVARGALCNHYHAKTTGTNGGFIERMTGQKWMEKKRHFDFLIWMLETWSACGDRLPLMLLEDSCPIPFPETFALETPEAWRPFI